MCRCRNVDEDVRMCACAFRCVLANGCIWVCMQGHMSE